MEAYKSYKRHRHEQLLSNIAALDCNAHSHKQHPLFLAMQRNRQRSIPRTIHHREPRYLAIRFKKHRYSTSSWKFLLITFRCLKKLLKRTLFYLYNWWPWPGSYFWFEFYVGKFSKWSSFPNTIYELPRTFNCASNPFSVNHTCIHGTKFIIDGCPIYSIRCFVCNVVTGIYFLPKIFSTKNLWY